MYPANLGPSLGAEDGVAVGLDTLVHVLLMHGRQAVAVSRHIASAISIVFWE